MQMAMWNFKSSNDQRNTIAVENTLLRLGNALGNPKAMLGDVIWQICPLIYLCSRDNEQVSARNGVDRHKCDANLIGVHECARQFACDDACEY